LEIPAARFAGLRAHRARIARFRDVHGTVAARGPAQRVDTRRIVAAR
jgi:hypothetical protein